jgi:hypothetical protein
VTANRHLIDSGLAMVDGGDAVFDPGGEHEVGDDSVSRRPRHVLVSPQKRRLRVPAHLVKA